MVKINIIKRTDNGANKYSINLPKDIMDSLVVSKGDELIFVGEMAGELRFKLRRKSEIDSVKLKLAEERVLELKNTMH